MYDNFRITATQLFALIFLLFVGLVWRRLHKKAVDLLSYLLNYGLCFSFPVSHINTRLPLPTVPYRWPNGQGDVEKFLHGRENSELWAREHGNLYRIWSGMTPEVVLTDSEQLKAVFRDSDKHVKAVNNNSGYLMSQILGQCVGLISHQSWRDVRAIVEKPFLRTSTSNHFSLIWNRTQAFLDKLCASRILPKGLVHPAEDLKLLPFWIVAEIIYGELTPAMEASLIELVPLREDLFKHVIAGGLSRFSWFKHLPTTGNFLLREFQKKWSIFNEQAYKHAVSLQNDAPIIEMFQAVKDKKITLQQLYQTIDEMLYANLDVTLGGISWNLVFLAANNDVQARLRAEASQWHIQVLADSSAASQYYLDSSSYLAACIYESSRLRPLAAFSVPQAIPTARTISGYTFPAGTNFIVDAYALNVRNPFWGPDRTAYRPERFLERNATEMRYHFWRFGFGPRQCMGKYVADLILRVLLAQLVQGYELALLDGMEKDWARNGEMWISHPSMDLRCKKRENPKSEE